MAITNVLNEILKWSETCPGWQRDALRRLFTTGTLVDTDLAELTELCKAHFGLAPATKPNVLTTDHLAITEAGVSPVTLLSVTHQRGVNALAENQTVSFGPKLTIIYGENASGKSGYTRVLKRACRSRFVEDILGDVLSTSTPLKALVTICGQVGSDPFKVEWTPDGASASALGSVSVFDGHCVPAYLKDKTDVAFRPFSLDIFDKLAQLCGEVRRRLELENDALKMAVNSLPQDLREGTSAKAFIANLTALTKEADVAAVTTLSDAEKRRLKELQDRFRDATAADPKRLARDLELKADRIEGLANHLRDTIAAFSPEATASVQAAATRLSSARQALDLLRSTAITQNVLSGTGEAAWRTMWEGAEGFSQVAYPEQAFPVTDNDALCVLCQQPIGTDAAERLKHFAEYVASTAQAELRAANTAFQKALAAVTTFTVVRADLNPVIEELEADTPGSKEQITELLQAATVLHTAILESAKANKPFPAGGLATQVEEIVRSTAASLRARAEQLVVAPAGMSSAETLELNELEGRLALAKYVDAILAEIEKKKRLSAYAQAIGDTNTLQITKKSTELTKQLITDQLRSTFQDELKRLEFEHLSVEIQSAGGSKGSQFHKLVFSNAPGIAITKVLSEGESRALSLAAFLTELSTAPAASAIIFDDPVSSLDHQWRGRMARRLVLEAKMRQVIVFTHDLLFLRALIDHCDTLGVTPQHQFMRRDGSAGFCSPDLPWLAMKVKDRIGVMRKRWQDADAAFRNKGQQAYEPLARDLFALLRESWERGVSEVLLNDVVERYRHSIETHRVSPLHDITEADCAAVDEGMAECSRWMRGHDEALADGAPFPTAADLKARIEALDVWVKKIRGRRS